MAEVTKSDPIDRLATSFAERDLNDPAWHERIRLHWGLIWEELKPEVKELLLRNRFALPDEIIRAGRLS